MSIVRTYTGRNLDLLNPDPKEIDIQDIAHHLAKLDRYNGAGHYHYSVGQHSLLVADALPKEYKLQGLLHDATEAYLGDVVSPLKKLLPDYRKIEQGVMAAVCKRYDITFPRPNIIKRADQAVMAAEMLQVVKWPDLPKKQGLPEPPKGMKIEPMGWKAVREVFIQRFKELHREHQQNRGMGL